MPPKKHESGMAYNMVRLNRLFAFLSFFLLATVLWVFLDDYIRPWKIVQLEARQIERKKLDEQIAEEEETIDGDKLQGLERELHEARAQLAQRTGEREEISDSLREIQKEITAETITGGRLNALSADQNYRYEQAQGHGANRAQVERLRRDLLEYRRQFAQSRERMKGLEGRQKSLRSQLAEISAQETEAQRALDEMLRRKNLLELARNKTNSDIVFFVRNAPFFDFMDPTLRIEQLVVDTALDDRYFQHVPKVDRCITCHTFIDRPGYENEPNPHRTHPNLDLMVGAEGHHPMKQFGCTSCHGGEGHRVNDFVAAAHTPQNEEQKARWVAQYNWHEPHKIPQPMYKLQYTESQCLKCHQGVEYVPEAPKLNAGIQMMEEYGCYACHRIEGWEHKRRPGPSLQRIASKVTKEFFKNWVWSPKGFNKQALMPSFFMQSNNRDEESVAKNIAEVNAMAQYVWDKSQDYSPLDTYTGGDGARGKELVGQIGCMGCHGVEGFEGESRQVGARAGPYLGNLGSKIKDPNWLITWLKRPDHYDPETIMPSFRLTDAEAQDIATYLLSLKNPGFESLVFEETDEAVRDELLIDYLAAFDTREEATRKVLAMGPHEKDLELGRRSIGKYGCYSCHAIEGFDGLPPVGPELTEEGTKPLTQFAFNLQHTVEHSRDGWIKAHLENPRRWDDGLQKDFKDLTKMPNFNFTQAQAESLTLVLLGFVGEEIPLKGQKRLDEYEQLWAQGQRLVNKFNCYGCHQVDGMRGEILAMYGDDLNAAPPRLVDQGRRVQTDWFYHFLEDVHPIRPWLQVRMPSFKLTPEERNTIVSGFQGKSQQQTFVELRPELNDALAWISPEEEAEAGRLFNALVCASCHTQGYNSDPPLAPDLRMTKRKLRPEWTKVWLSNPQAIYPETSMPNFWENGESLAPDYFGGDAQKQQDALVKYLYHRGWEKIPLSQND